MKMTTGMKFAVVFAASLLLMTSCGKSPSNDKNVTSQAELAEVAMSEEHFEPVSAAP